MPSSSSVSKPVVTGQPPQFCCFCKNAGVRVHHMSGSFYEMDCPICERQAIVSIDDGMSVKNKTVV